MVGTQWLTERKIIQICPITVKAKAVFFYEEYNDPNDENKRTGFVIEKRVVLALAMKEIWSRKMETGYIEPSSRDIEIVPLCQEDFWDTNLFSIDDPTSALTTYLGLEIEGEEARDWNTLAASMIKESDRKKAGKV